MHWQPERSVLVPKFGLDASTRRLRRAAITLARMAPVDRDWILAQLSSAEHARLSEALGSTTQFSAMVQAGKPTAATSVVQSAQSVESAGDAGDHAAPARLQLLATLAPDPAADWLVRALVRTLPSTDLAH